MSATSETLLSDFETATEPGAQPRAGIRSVAVGFELFNALALAPGALMLRDLAAAAGMNAAKAHPYLVSFQRMGLVMQDPLSTRCDLGPAALALGLVVLGSVATLDTRWNSEPARAMLACTQQLSADLGCRCPPPTQ